MLAKDMRFNKIEKMFQAQGKVKVACRQSTVGFAIRL